MQIKCLLFTKQFFSPIKTTILDLPAGLTDSEIEAKAMAEFMKDFHVELEDVKNPRHREYKGQLPVRPDTVAQQKPEAPRKNRASIFEHNGIRYKRADIMKLHNMSAGQYNHLMNVRKYSAAEVIEKGLALYKRKRVS